LTKKESKLFELLLLNKNKIVKIEDIKKHIWIDKEVSDSALKTMFSRLTNKIGKDVITNSFGVGYGIYEK
jgi:DNA-binding response OmpR family regulator